MKTQVFLLVPYDVRPEDIGEYERLLLEGHRLTPDDLSTCGRFDHLVGCPGEVAQRPYSRRTAAAERLPRHSGNICERANLPADVVPGALVTPDGEWHDLRDFGWRMAVGTSEENRTAFALWTARYRELIAAHENCWVVEVWAHSSWPIGDIVRRSYRTQSWGARSANRGTEVLLNPRVARPSTLQALHQLGSPS